MEYRRFNDTYVIRMDRGEEVLTTLTGICEQEGIRLAAVSAIGAVDRAVVGLYDVGEQVYHKKEFCEPMEIASLLGTVSEKDGKPYLHLHATLCDASMQTHGGHVNELWISVTCEMILRLLPGEVGRRLDEVTGLNVFDFD
ncbi:MAG: DNA-binding protein [Clostridia bacterium]|nr:DNA-binding protein [Clostridia bacterium]MBR0205452.1 DNA-binding protein [Clostridia bacterium]